MKKLFIIGIFLFLSSCGLFSIKEEDLIGEWKYYRRPGNFLFKKNGTVLIINETMYGEDVKIFGTWITSDLIVKITIPKKGDLYLTFGISDGRFIMSYGNGDIFAYKLYHLP